MESYRGWHITKRNGRTLLISNGNFLWEQSEVKAICNHGCEVGLCLLEHKCQCGIYSLKTMNNVLDQYFNMDIYGVIYNHGSLIEGTTGFRSEYATVRALYTSDIKLGDELSISYPDVAIMLPTPDIERRKMELKPAYLWDIQWKIKQQKHKEKQQKIQEAIDLAKEIYPGGPEAEKQRLLDLLRGASRQQIVEFAKEYGSGDWHQRFWLHKKENSRKAKPGDIIFEANDDTKPYVYIGSTRVTSNGMSMRYMFGRNGILYKRANIRKWDEEPELTESRKLAIEEWE